MATIDEHYWAKRLPTYFKKLEKDEKKVIAKLNKEYKKQAKYLEKEIANVYSKYGKDNIIDYKDLLIHLNKNERDMLLTDVNRFFNQHPELEHFREIDRDAYKINRLDELKFNLNKEQLILADKEDKIVTEHLKDSYIKGFKNVSKDFNFNSLAYNPDRVNAILSTPWVGRDMYKDRIWKNREKVADYINNEFKSGVIRGDTYSTMANNLATKLKIKSSKNIKALIYTEGTYVQNQAMLQPFVDTGYKYYEYSAILDERTTEECEGLDGLIFKIEDMEVGTNFPPIHVNCRSSFTIKGD